jgi:hypothetical protein
MTRVSCRLGLGVKWAYAGSYVDAKLMARAAMEKACVVVEKEAKRVIGRRP